jgi:tripartite-type tricarboxylate transporter receptor subunit TctC
LSISGFGGIFVPAHTPTGLISKLNLELNTALADPEVRAAASRVGENLVGGSPDTLAKTLAAATANYAQEATPGAAKPGSK